MSAKQIGLAHPPRVSDIEREDLEQLLYMDLGVETLCYSGPSVRVSIDTPDQVAETERVLLRITSVPELRHEYFGSFADIADLSQPA